MTDRQVSVAERRRQLVRHHRLAGRAASPEEATAAVLALHATDPASVYLSVLARCATASLDDVADALYTRRSLVRRLAMRRTLFVFATGDVPMVQAAVSTPLAAGLRRRLISQLERNGTDPPLPDDVGGWVHRLEDEVARALERRGTATGAELAADIPGLRTAIRVRAPSDRPQKVTTSLLTLLGAQGRIVRGFPTGPWTSRHHRWEPADHWWPDGISDQKPEDAERELARRWLARFGPATIDDLQWWTGWSKSTTGRALDRLPLDEVDLHGRPGIALTSGSEPNEPAEPEGPVAALLPALDPTPMGWRHRDWFFGIDPRRVFDRAGNIGPTVWWNGEIVGSWAVAEDGRVITALEADRGSDARSAVHAAADTLTGRLHGTPVTPAVRTPLERSLVHPAGPPGAPE